MTAATEAGSSVAVPGSRALAARHVPTTLYGDPKDFRPEEGSAYFYGHTDEERSSHLDAWTEEGLTVPVLIEPYPDEIGVNTSGGAQRLSLYSRKHLDALWRGVGDIVYVDITGLPHHVWAPLIAGALRAEKTLRVVYVEPGDYKRSRARYQLYDLSEERLGIRPLPGFASLFPTYDDFTFVPLLGFEDARFSYVLNKVDPLADRVYPVVGVPGFRPEYPSETYRSNRRTLSDGPRGLYTQNVRFADAACPFRLYYVLEDIAAVHSSSVIKVGLLGTKPHALGAVLFALANRMSGVELVYDHPQRSGGRTRGTSRLLVYHLSAFVPALIAP